MIRSMKVLVSLATIFLAACATTPTPDTKTTSQPPAAAAAAAPAAADTKTAADRRFAEETRGYKLVERNGRNYYCRTERPSGSNLKSQVCRTETELRQLVEDAEMYRRKSKASVCAPDDPRCGGA